MVRAFAVLLCGLPAVAAYCGPPFISDDPEPTDYGHYEIYLFAQGSSARDGVGSSYGIDFNYGALPNLQLTAVLPIEVATPAAGPTVAGLGNVELAAKYKVLHREDVGWDVAFFPRVFLPSGSANVGDKHASLLLPIWAGRDWGDWSSFGGGGCVINGGGDSQDYCLMGWVLTRHILPDLQVGAEIVHQGADTKGGRVSTGVGGGLIYDLNENVHLLAYAGPGLENAAATTQYTWYTSVLFTF
jgi:Putative MetA-pathway of phenol degradation